MTGTARHASGRANREAQVTGPVLARTRSDLAALPRPDGVVLTMGALHEGHTALIRAARAQCATVAVTIFVNPTQFAPGEDFDRYPRTPHSDLALCAAEGVDVVFAPSPAGVYRTPVRVSVDPGPLGRELEGATRPGHFSGVLTVVHKLLGITGAGATFFGEKDYQQLVLVRTMAADLDLPVRVLGVPTVREPDGLARSSRNRYLSAEERELAAALPAALRAGAEAGPGGADTVVRAARTVLADAGIRPEYLVLRDRELGPAPESGPARLLVAATVGTTRLIDNMAVTVAEA